MTRVRSDQGPLFTLKQEPLPFSLMQVLRAQRFSEKVYDNSVYLLHQAPVYLSAWG